MKGSHNRHFAEYLACRRLLLACTQTGFDQPLTGRRLEMETPVSGEFAAILACIGGDTVQ